MDKPIYGKILNDVARNPEISKPAKALYMVLCTYRNTHTNTCWPKNETLCEDLNTDRYMIAKWLKELEKHNVIRVEIDYHYKDKYKQRIIRFLHCYSDHAVLNTQGT